MASKGKNSITDQGSRLFDVDLEPRPLFGRVIGGSPQPNDSIERILSAAGASLATIHSGMVHEEHGDALPPEP